MTLGERIKAIRGTLSRDKFAPQTGIGKTALVNYETGERNPPSDYLLKILEQYPDISPAWLLTGEGEMKRGDSSVFPNQLNIEVVGKKIRQVRGNLTPTQFIDRLGVILTEERLIDIEEGRIEPSYGLLNCICLEFIINGSWLIGNSQNMSSDETDKGGVDIKLIDVTCMIVDALDEMRSDKDEPMSSQKKNFLAGRLYEHLRRQGLDLDKESPLQEMIRLETENSKAV